MARKNSFLLIPLGTIQDLVEGKEYYYDGAKVSCINLIFEIGIYTSAQRIKAKKIDMQKNFIYCGYRQKECLTPDLLKIWNYLLKAPESDWCFQNGGLWGFGKEGFDPKNELDCLKFHFIKNPGKEEIVYEWARVIDMLDLLDLKRNGASYTIGLVTNSHIYQNYNRMPLISVNSEVMWNLYQHRMTMSDEERATLAMYLGICSKIGSKTFAATTKDEILCRMFGMAKKEDLTLRMKGDRAFKKLYEHYATRRRYEKLLGMVEERYGIRAIGLKRRTYVSFCFKTDDAFMAAIAASDKKLQAAKRKEHLAELKEKYFPTQPEQDQ